MRRSKRFLSAVLALLLCLSMLPVSALALELPELDVLEDVIAAVEAEEVIEEIPAVEEVEEPAEAEGMLKDNLNVDDDCCIVVETAQTLESYDGYVRTESEFQDALLNNTVIYLKKDIVLTENHTIPSGKSVILDDGFELSVSKGVTLINEGHIQIGMATHVSDTEIVYDTAYLVVQGALVNDGHISIIENGVLNGNGSLSGGGTISVGIHDSSDLENYERVRSLFECHLRIENDVQLNRSLYLGNDDFLGISNNAVLTVPELVNEGYIQMGIETSIDDKWTYTAATINVVGTFKNTGYIDIDEDCIVSVGDVLVNEKTIRLYQSAFLTVSNEITGSGYVEILLDAVNGWDSYQRLIGKTKCRLKVISDVSISGEFKLNNGDLFVIGNNATVTIEDNAVFSNDGDITIGESYGYINENGIFEWESEAATLVVEGTINNDGSMQVGNEGILDVNGEVSGDGVVRVWINEESDLNMCETLKELFDCHIYVGEDFELTRDFVLGEGYLYIGNEATLTVNPGIRFTVEETGHVFVGSFDYGPIGEDNEDDVWGKLYIQGDLLNNGMLVVHERGELIIEGTYSGNGYVSYADGSEDDESEIKLAEVTTADELREAVNSGYTSIWIVENIAINEDLHLTEEKGVIIKNNATLTVPKGVKLTNDGYMLIGDSKGTFDDNGELILEYEKGALNIEGELVNNGSIDVLEWGQLKISGEVSGSGLAWIIVDDPLDFEMYKTMPTEFECRLWVENDMSLVDDLFVDSNDVITIENEAVLTVPIGTVLGNNGIINIGVSYSYEVDGVTHWDHIGGTLYVQNTLVNNGEVNVARQGKLIVTGNATGEGAINHDIDEENESKAGDSDGDGIIETEDLVHLMKCIVNDDISGLSGNSGDVNEDGEVDILDVIRLIRMLAA